MEVIKTRDALLMIWRGHKALVRNFLRAADNAVIHYPYLFIILTVVLCTIIGVVNVGRARAERDHYGHEYYLMEQWCDSLLFIIEADR